jgi:hypothetical protein
VFHERYITHTSAMIVTMIYLSIILFLETISDCRLAVSSVMNGIKHDVDILSFR